MKIIYILVIIQQHLFSGIDIKMKAYKNLLSCLEAKESISDSQVECIPLHVNNKVTK